jgi:acetolactate synthase-1/2/3 large subunit
MRTMHAIRDVVGRDAIFTGDASISATRGGNACLPVYEPRSYLPPVWGGLGFAFPAAMGVKAGLPRRTVVCITGDGGFQFNVQELGTCVQYGLDPIVLVFNDDAWGSTRMRQKVNYDGRYIGTELKNPDFAKLAEAYGAEGYRVRSVEELIPALEDAARSKTVSVIEVLTPNGFENFA